MEDLKQVFLELYAAVEASQSEAWQISKELKSEIIAEYLSGKSPAEELEAKALVAQVHKYFSVFGANGAGLAWEFFEAASRKQATRKV